jgi:formate/nitrite transporter FocA (FNT family)
VFERTVDEGQRRVERRWSQMSATGAVGGIDVGLGVLALFVVKRETGDDTLASLAFGVGFIALTLAQSELFTENFLVPIAAIAAGRASWRQLLRLWVVTLAFNLIGGWVITGLIIAGIPNLAPVAVHIGRYYPAIGYGFHALALAMLGGCVITLMTWMVHSTDSVPAQLIAAFVTAFLVASARSTTPSWYRSRCSLRCTPAHPSGTRHGSKCSGGQPWATSWVG